MAFSISDLAHDLGIDVATLKPESVSKWNGYLSEADTKYHSATQAQKEAVEKLEAAKREQTAIDEQIQKFGVTETSLAELRASNAALTAALDEVKKQGFNVNMPNLPVPKADPADPLKELRDRQNLGFRQMGAAMRVQAKYQQIYGKPFGDDPISLIDEAIAARMDVEPYAEKKFDFAGEQKRRSEADMAKKKAEWETAAVNKYKEDNPQRTPLEQRGVASKHPQIFKPRDAASDKTFRNLPVKERIAQSVARVRASISNSDVA